MSTKADAKKIQHNEDVSYQRALQDVRTLRAKFADEIREKQAANPERTRPEIMLELWRREME